MSEDGWIEERNADAARFTLRAQELVGKTIAEARVNPHDNDCDCVNVLTLTFTDGSTAKVLATYGSWTGHSCDEYPQWITTSFQEETS